MMEANPGDNSHGKYVPANGIKMFYEEHGRGSALIFLHGSMGTGRVWRPYVPILSPHVRTIIPDLRGHGRTENTGAEIDLHLMGDDIAAMIDALQLTGPFICGWSLGGDIALDVAIRYPEKVGALIVGGVTHRLSETYRASLRAMGLEGPGQINFEQAGKAIPQLIELWKTEHAQSPNHWADLVTQMSQGMVNPTLPSENDLKGLSAPVLIIWGDRDQFLPLEDGVELYRMIPNARLAVVPNADHFVSRTRVELFASLVKEFVLSATT